MTIYTIGYSGWKNDDIRAAVDRLDAILVDVRMVPRSRVPQWSCYSLSRELGHRYAWVRELGNENYKGTVEQIKIANFPAGEKRLAGLAFGGKAINLLCSCPDVTQCHRKVLPDWLAQAWKAEVVHLTRPDNGISSGQPKLF